MNSTLFFVISRLNRENYWYNTSSISYLIFCLKPFNEYIVCMSWNLWILACFKNLFALLVTYCDRFYHQALRHTWMTFYCMFFYMYPCATCLLQHCRELLPSLWPILQYWCNILYLYNFYCFISLYVPHFWGLKWINKKIK